MGLTLSLAHQAGTWSSGIADILSALVLCDQRALCTSQGREDAARRCCTACATEQMKRVAQLQEAAAGDASDSAWQIQLQCLLATACLQLPSPPSKVAQQDTAQPPGDTASLPHTTTHTGQADLPLAQKAAQSQEATGHVHAAFKEQPPAISPPSLTKDTYSAVTVLSRELAVHFATWQRSMKAGTEQAITLSTALAKVQWQLAGLVERLYVSLSSSNAAQSPSHQNLNIKVRVAVPHRPCPYKIAHNVCLE